MISNPWVENSRKAYTLLLNLYPQEYRAEYGTAMRQVFTDQCRSDYREKGPLGLVLLWLRTLPDLGKTVLLEHTTSPSAGWGLLEPVPNAPLPWKGVFLILLPGLVYLISQIAQLTGQPWYLTVYYRAAFLLILPVLLVWGLTRRFPIWGLIPVGLLYRLCQEMGYQWLIMGGYVQTGNPILAAIFKASDLLQQNLFIPTLILFAALLFLAWRYVHLRKPVRRFWLWLGLYVLVAVVQLARDLSWIASSYQKMFASSEIWPAVKSSLSWYSFEFTAFLLLIFIGTLFTHRHGFFAILVPVGYILPTIVVGMPWSLDLVANPAISLSLISLAVLAYRVLLAFIAPLWVSRTGSQAGKKRAVLVSIVIALGIHAVMQFSSLWLYPDQFITDQWLFSVMLGELKLVSALILGVVMYQDVSPTARTMSDLPEKSAGLVAEKA